MGTNLLQSLEVITNLGVNTIREDLRVLSVNDILLSVEEPSGDFELGWVLDDGHKALEFIRVEITSTTNMLERWRNSISENTPFVEVDISFLANQVGVTTTDTLDLSQSIHDFAFSVNIGVEQTENVLRGVAFRLRTSPIERNSLGIVGGLRGQRATC